jgi:hypothetical protein
MAWNVNDVSRQAVQKCCSNSVSVEQSATCRRPPWTRQQFVRGLIAQLSRLIGQRHERNERTMGLDYSTWPVFRAE